MAEKNPGQAVKVIAHSQGGAIQKCALSVTAKKVKENLDILMVSSPEYISKEESGVRYVKHLVSSRDMIPYLSPLDRQQANKEGTLDIVKAETWNFLYEHSYDNKIFKERKIDHIKRIK